MSEITKLLAAVGLVTAGFFGASLFGNRDPADGSPAAGDSTPERLVPIESAPVPSDRQATWDSNVAPAGHFEDEPPFAADNSQPRSHQTARAEWPADCNDGWEHTAEVRRDAATGERRGFSTRRTSLDDSRLAGLTPPPLLEGKTTGRMQPVDRFPSPPSSSTPNEQPERTVESSTSRESQPDDRDRRAPSADGPSLAAPQAWTMSTPLPVRSEPQRTRGATAEWHVVSDGDSLAKLAERYLGDRSRADEIYDMNRDVLDNPELLPIGAELRIPARRSASDAYQVFDSSGMARGRYEPQRRLVPLPELSESVAATPRARLQPPVSSHVVNTSQPSDHALP